MQTPSPFADLVGFVATLWIVGLVLSGMTGHHKGYLKKTLGFALCPFKGIWKAHKKVIIAFIIGILFALWLIATAERM